LCLLKLRLQYKKSYLQVKWLPKHGWRICRGSDKSLIVSSAMTMKDEESSCEYIEIEK